MILLSSLGVMIILASQNELGSVSTSSSISGKSLWRIGVNSLNIWESLVVKPSSPGFSL